MKIRISLKGIYSFFIAFVLTDGFLVEYISKYSGAEVGATVGRVALYVVVILSIIIIAFDFSLVKKAIAPFVFLMVLGLYQTIMFSHPAESSYVRDFIIQGAGGLLVGLSLNDYIGIIKKAGFISFVYGLFLIAEPINGKLLGLNIMSLGYTIIPYVIWMFAAVFICGKKQYWLLICAVPLAITTILFTSRGCGLSIILAVLILYNLRAHARGEKINSKIVIAGVTLAVAFIVFSIVSSLGLFSNVKLSEGAALYKILNGSFSSSNGRSEVWEFGLYTIKNNWMTGIGFGNDIELAKSWMMRYSFVHNVFLELFLHFGVPIGILVIFFYLRKCILTIRESNDYSFKGFVIAMAFSYCFMLLFSSQYITHIFQIMIVFGACTIHYAKSKEYKTYS